jgi:hypothetical protein
MISAADTQFLADFHSLAEPGFFFRLCHVSCRLSDTPWTADERAAVVALRKAGRSLEDIAEYLERPKIEVDVELAKQGVCAINGGVSPALVIDTYGFSEYALQEALRVTTGRDNGRAQKVLIALAHELIDELELAQRGGHTRSVAAVHGDLCDAVCRLV